ncbi:MAG: hypothetical protein Kow00107_03810 [Planctomycetota bacterium]
MEKHAFNDVQPPQEREPSISDNMNAIILKMMARDKSLRYPTPADLIRDFELLKAGKMTVALQELLIREGKLDPSTLVKKDRSTIAVVAIVVVIVACVAAAMAIFGKDGSNGTALSTAPPPMTSTRTTQEPTKVPKSRIDLQAAAQSLESLKELKVESYTDNLKIIEECAKVISSYPGTPAATEAQKIARAAAKAFEEHVATEIEKKNAQAMELIAAGKLNEALSVFFELPPEFMFAKSWTGIPVLQAEVVKKVTEIVTSRINKARDLVASSKFEEARRLLDELRTQVPAEYTSTVRNIIRTMEEARDQRVASEFRLDSVKLLDLTLSGQFAAAAEIIRKYVDDPLYFDYRERMEEASKFLDHIRFTIECARERLKEMVGKNVSISLDGSVMIRELRVMKVGEDNSLELYDVTAKEKIATTLSSVSPISVAALAEERVRKLKREEEAPGLYSICVYLFFCGRFYEAEKTLEAAAKLGIDASQFQEIKNRYRPMILDRFALRTFNKLQEAENAGAWQDVLALTDQLVSQYSDSSVVNSNIASIKRSRAKAQINVAGLPEMFAGRLSIDETGMLVFEYDFSEERQLEDFAYSALHWKVIDNALHCEADPEYIHGLHHFALLAGDREIEIEYLNAKPNSMCLYFGGKWWGINSHNTTADIVDVLPASEQWKAFYGHKTEFAFYSDDLRTVKFSISGGKGRISNGADVLVEKEISAVPSGFEIRDLGYATIRKITIRGQADAAWLKVLTDIKGLTDSGKLQKGLVRTAYSDPYFSRKVDRVFVSAICDHFAVAPSPKMSSSKYSVKYEGYIYLPADGQYEFTIKTTARTRFRIDGNSLHDTIGTGVAPQAITSVRIKLTAGLHKLELFLTNDDIRDQTVRLEFDCGTGGSALVPGIILFSEP